MSLRGMEVEIEGKAHVDAHGSIRKPLFGPDGSIIEVVKTDVSDVLKANAEARADSNNGYSQSRDMRRVASIPMVVIEQWIREGLNPFDKNNKKKVMKKLASPEYAHLRTVDRW